MPTESDVKIIKSVCNMCMQCCGIDAHIRDGRLIKVTAMEDHPYNHLCVKAQGIVDWLYSPDRVTTPLKRANGDWQPITWDEAFDIITDKLTMVKEKYGAKAMATHMGNPFIGTPVGRVASRFCSLYGTPNHTSTASLCFAAGAMGHGLTISNRLQRLFPSFENSRCMVLWGYNPQESNICDMVQITPARKNGAKLIVIDPRKTPLAKEADIHAQIRPGTDVALALGMINVIIAEQLYDQDFVHNWTVGFEKLAEHVKKYSPEDVEKLTWVPADTVREIARMYAASKPAAIAQGVALDHCLGGVQNSRAAAILMAITGNLDVPGGNVYLATLRMAQLRVKGNVDTSEVVGIDYPVYNRFVGESTCLPLAETIITGKPYPIKAMIVHGSNPALIWPDSNKVKQALSQLDFLVVSDLFMSETARLADVFLPSITFWEGDILKDYQFVGLPMAVLANKVVEPLGECRDNWQIWAELGRRMGYAEYFPWQTTDELINDLLEPSGITIEQLREHPSGVWYGNMGQKQKYLEKGLKTSSGKVELFSETLEGYGYAPLPEFTEPLPALVGTPELAEDYPLILTTGARVGPFTHSRHRNVARLRKLAPYPAVEINTDTARNMGIATDDWVIVESPRGSLRIRAKVTDDIHPRVVSIPHGWEEANVNLLTDGDARDPISAYPGYKAAICRVTRD
ncbi:MAG: molybdopterin-dependent oxidoreductase [Chloroflexi bacterium]|nr:molybdopterin-dependent oxidoreductase [Chloroflexota bacterium]